MNNGDQMSGLITAAQTGDPFALQKLLEHWYPDLRRYAQKHCQASYVDDAVQETLLVMSRKIKAVRSISSFSAWLFTIVKRHCQSVFRRMHLNVHIDEAEWAEFIDSKPHPQLRLELVAALESLPEHYLQIILLRDFEELTLSEIAKRLNENIPAIKSRLHRARTLVREYLTAKS
ncbi:RNA polymerase sigma factor [Cellvibrio sp.]|uniref:RNA polymerase sigma factor n=1 Tax=Cellvibrio sp. TaxID=1965322 RepID=UPI0039647BAA